MSKSHRAAWRQRLIDAETGFRIGFRTGSTLFTYLFIAIGVVFAGIVIQLSLVEWAILALTLGLSLSMELFHQLLTLLVFEFRHHLPQDISQLLRLGTAAVVVTNASTIIVLTLVIGSRIIEAIN